MQAIYIFLVILIVLLSFAFDYFIKNRRKKLTGHLASLLMSKQYALFDQLINSPKVKKWLPAYNLCFLKFNSWVVRQQKDKANRIFAQILQMHLHSRQALDFYGQALSYYIDSNDAKRSQKCIMKINKINGYKTEKNYLKSLYRIVMLGDTRDESLIKSRLKFDDKQTKVTDYYLLAHISKVKKDFTKAKEYNRLADQTITDIVK